MSALKEGLAPLARISQLEDQLAEARADRCHLYDRLDAQTQLRVRAEDSVALLTGTVGLLAEAVCKGEAFGDWLLMQDASSAVSFSPARKRKMIEEKTDLELALEFIASTAAG